MSETTPPAVSAAAQSVAIVAGTAQSNPYQLKSSFLEYRHQDYEYKNHHFRKENKIKIKLVEDDYDDDNESEYNDTINPQGNDHTAESKISSNLNKKKDNNYNNKYNRLKLPTSSSISITIPPLAAQWEFNSKNEDEENNADENSVNQTNAPLKTFSKNRSKKKNEEEEFDDDSAFVDVASSTNNIKTNSNQFNSDLISIDSSSTSTTTSPTDKLNELNIECTGGSVSKRKILSDADELDVCKKLAKPDEEQDTVNTESLAMQFSSPQQAESLKEEQTNSSASFNEYSSPLTESTSNEIFTITLKYQQSGSMGNDEILVRNVSKNVHYFLKFTQVSIEPIYRVLKF